MGFHLHEPWHLCPPIGKGPVLIFADNCNLCEEKRQVNKKIYHTFKEAPNTKDQEGKEEVGGEVVKSGHHHTRGAWIDLVGDSVTCGVGSPEVEAGTARGDWGGVVEVGESQGAGDGFR